MTEVTALKSKNPLKRYVFFNFRIPKKSENTVNILSDILKLESGRPGGIKVKPPAPRKRKTVKQTKGTQTSQTSTNPAQFDAIARLEEEFEKSFEDLGISEKVKAKLSSSSVELQREFYYR